MSCLTRSLLPVFFAAFVWVSANCDLLAQQATDQAVCDGELAQRVKTQVDQMTKESGFSGAILMARDGHVLLAHAIGDSVGDETAPLQTTTLFEIASCTKSFTGIALVLLQQQGKVDLDDSIADYLPNVPDHSKAITVRHLLQHTSGIPGDTYGPATEDATEAVAAFLRNPPSVEPGTRHEYWNQGYALLSEIIAKASGMSFAEFCKKEIFDVCEMNSSCFNGDEPPVGSIVAIGKSNRGPDRSALSHPYSTSYDFSYRAMGGMVTNVWDLWRFGNVLSDKSLLNAESMKELATIGQSDYALGWRVEGKDDSQALWHNGSVRGFFCAMKYFPDTNSCLIVLCNNGDGSKMRPVWAFCDQAIKGKLLSPIDAESLTKIAGTYTAGSRSFIIPNEGTNPTAHFGWGGPTTSGTLGKMESGEFGFFDGDQNYPVEFEFDEDGNAIKCQVFDTELSRKQ